MKKQKCILLLIILTTCLSFNDAQIQKKSIAKGNAHNVKTEIKFPAGKLHIKPGSSNNLVEGVYFFSDKQWAPEIHYHESNTKGYLSIKSPDLEGEHNFDDSDSCVWNIRINEATQQDLGIKFFAGEGIVDLQNCNLNRFEFEMFAGDANIKLKNTSVPIVNFKAFAGEALLDFSGEWKNDLHADIIGGFGELNIIIPRNYGARIEITGLLGEVDLPGFHKNENSYTNSIFGTTDVNLFIKIVGGIGEVNFEYAD